MMTMTTTMTMCFGGAEAGLLEGETLVGQGPQKRFSSSSSLTAAHPYYTRWKMAVMAASDNFGTVSTTHAFPY
eukprot:1771398-Karenia_brevis.AAC.1